MNFTYTASTGQSSLVPDRKLVHVCFDEYVTYHMRAKALEQVMREQGIVEGPNVQHSWCSSYELRIAIDPKEE